MLPDILAGRFFSRSMMRSWSADIDREYLSETAVFGSVKKNVLSKNFGGGETTAVFGGIEINLLHASIQGTAVIECTQIFGGTKLIVPADWLIVSEMSSILGGIEDKRMPQQSYSEGKKLIIRGTTLFGGLEIISY